MQGIVSTVGCPGGGSSVVEHCWLKQKPWVRFPPTGSFSVWSIQIRETQSMADGETFQLTTAHVSDGTY